MATSMGMDTQYFTNSESIKNSKISTMDDDSLIMVFRECWDMWQNAFGPNISFGKFASDFAFVPGMQWKESDTAGSAGISNNRDVQTDREGRGKSCYEFNALRAILRQLYAEQKLNSPQGMLIAAQDSEMPTESLNIVQGAYRHDCYKSDTKHVYGMAYQNSTSRGFGAYYLAPEKESPLSFNDVLRFHAINDSSYSFFDPTAKQITKWDGNFGGHICATLYRDLKASFPDKDFEQDIGASFCGISVGKGQVAYANFYVREPTTITIYELKETGKVVTSKEYNKMKKGIDKYNEIEKKRINNRRKMLKEENVPEEEWPTFVKAEYPEYSRKQKSPSCNIYHVILTKSTVLSKVKLPIKEFLPIFYVPGDFVWNNGQEMTMPLIQEAMTAQKQLNYLFSELIDQVDKSFGNVIVANVEAVGNKTQIFSRPTIGNLMTYSTPINPQAGDGRPYLIASNAVDQGLLAAYQEMLNTIYATLGRSLENHGGETNAQSGRAILARKSSGELSVGVYADNLNEAIGVGTKCWMEWAPHVYDTERQLVIQDEDGRIKRVMINQADGSLVDAVGKIQLKNKFSFEMAEFRVECVGGTSFAGQANSAINTLLAITAQDPEALSKLTTDITVKLLPFPWANQLVRRLKESGYINPAVVAAESGKPPPPPPESPAQRLEQSKLSQQQLKMVGEFVKLKQQDKQAMIDMWTQALKTKSDISGDVSDLAKAYSTAPFPEIATALEDSLDMLDDMNEVTESAMEQYLPQFAQYELTEQQE